MLDYLFSWKVYRSLKAGLLVDFYLKKSFYYMFRSVVINIALFFTDKFLIELISKAWVLLMKHSTRFLLSMTNLNVVDFYVIILKLNILFILSFLGYYWYVQSIFENFFI